MTDAAPAHRSRLRPLRRGTVLAGRFVIDDAVGGLESSHLYTATDAALGERPVLVIDVPVDALERAQAFWLESIRVAAVAPLIDIVELRDRAAAIFDAGADATPLDALVGVSREQRAALMVELARALEVTERGAAPARWLGPGQAWVLGAPDDPRLRIVPLFDPRGATESTRADENAALCRLIAQQLFGVDPVAPPDVVLARLPDSVSAALAPLYADDPSARAGVVLSSATLARALGIDGGASRVPVPRSPPVSPTLPARIASARRHVQRVNKLEVTVALALIAVVLIGAMALFTVRTLETHEPVVAEEARAPAEVASLPQPIANALSPYEVLWPNEQARFFRTLLEEGPVPRVAGQIENSARRFAWEGYVRAFQDDEGRIVRAELFEPAELFTGFVTWAYDDNGAVTERVAFGPTGVELSRRRYDHTRGTYSGHLLSGAPEAPPCASVAFSLGADGAFTELSCLDADGAAATFSAGYHRQVVDGDGNSRRRRHFDFDGEPTTRRDGVHSVLEERDEEGRLVEVWFYGLDGAPMRDLTYGAAKITWEYFPRELRVSLFDAQGEPTLGAAGWHQSVLSRDFSGAPSSHQTLGVDGLPILPHGSAVARVEYRSDGRGRVATQFWLDLNGEPVADASGVHRIETVRDVHDNVLRECHFGVDGPILSVALHGVHCVAHEHDRHGNPVLTSFYDVNGRPMLGQAERVHRVRNRFDARHRLDRRAFFDAEDQPALTWSGHHFVLFRYDDEGRLVGYNYYDEAGAPATSQTGIASVAIERDGFGREVRRCFADGDGAPASFADGLATGAACFEWEYHDSGKIAAIRYTDAEGEPVNAGFGGALLAAVIKMEYSPGGQLIAQEFEFSDPRGAAVQRRDCRQAERCVDATGWAWHIP